MYSKRSKPNLTNQGKTNPTFSPTQDSNANVSANPNPDPDPDIKEGQKHLDRLFADANNVVRIYQLAWLQDTKRAQRLKERIKVPSITDMLCMRTVESRVTRFTKAHTRMELSKDLFLHIREHFPRLVAESIVKSAERFVGINWLKHHKSSYTNSSAVDELLSTPSHADAQASTQPRARTTSVH